MKKQILNYGKELDRSELLNIKGGDCQYDNPSDCESECSVDCVSRIRYLRPGEPASSAFVWYCNDTEDALN